MKVLVIGQDQGGLEQLEDRLQVGCEVRTARRAPEALAIAQPEQPR